MNILKTIVIVHLNNTFIYFLKNKSNNIYIYISIHNYSKLVTTIKGGRFEPLTFPLKY